MTLSLAVFLAVLALLLPFTLAQLSTAICMPDYGWMNNTLLQSPCVVASYLEKQCISGSWTVVSLGGAGPYDPPTNATASPCRCNPVVYNLLQACSFCQGGAIGSWSNWTENCPGTILDESKFPLPIPGGTAVPNWASVLPDTVGGTWNMQDSMQLAAKGGELTSGGASKHSNTGLIIGSVLGAVGLVVLIGLAIFFVSRTLKKSKQATATTDPLLPPDTKRGLQHPSSDTLRSKGSTLSGYQYTPLKAPDLDAEGHYGESKRRSMSYPLQHTSMPAGLYDPPTQSRTSFDRQSRPTSIHSVSYPPYPSSAQDPFSPQERRFRGEMSPYGGTSPQPSSQSQGLYRGDDSPQRHSMSTHSQHSRSSTWAPGQWSLSPAATFRGLPEI